MTQTCFPFDSGSGGSVTEAQWSKMAQHWLGTGVIKSVLNELQVYADSTGMQAKVKTGQAWIKGHLFESDAEEVLPIAAADSSNPRIDRVIIRLDWPGNSGQLAVLQGIPAVSPVAPTLTQNSSRWEISLSQVYVGANVATIAAGNVTDEREFVKNLNGEAKPNWIDLTLQNGWVAGSISPQYAIEGNKVIFRGRIKNGPLGSGNYTPAFTLPSGYQSLQSQSFICGGYGSNYWARIYALAYNSSQSPGGVSVITTASGSTSDEIDLTQIKFYYK